MASAEAVEYRFSDQGAKTIALPGAFAGLVNPTNGTIYKADPYGLGESFAFPVVLDTGSSGHVLAESIAGSDMLKIPTTGETYSDVGIGGTETFNVSQPTRLILSSVIVGEENSEVQSNYATYGNPNGYKFQIRQSDPTVFGWYPIAVDIVGTPVLNQYVMHVKPNSVPYTSLIPTLDYMETDLLASMPAIPVSTTALHIPLSYQNFVDPDAPVSTAANPMIPGVKVVDHRKPADEQPGASSWLFDTGGSITIVGENMAKAIGIDTATETPVTTVDVAGIGDAVRTFLGYRVDSLIVPLNGSSELIFENLVVFVPEPGMGLPADLPGIFGMNLIGQSFTYDADGFPLDITDSPFSDWYVDPFGSEVVLIPGVTPEPGTLVLLAIGGSLLLLRRLLRHRG